MSLLATWIWQGVALTLAIAALLRLWRPGAAACTFVWWATLLAVLLLPLPWLVPQSPDPRVSNLQAGAPTIGVAIPVPPDAFISVAIGMWLGGVLLGLLTLVHGFVKLRRVKARCSPLSLARERCLRGWMAARHGRSARLCVSDDVALATALGLGSPVIAVNTSLASALDDRELDQLVLHEYAHLERFDDWSQLLQAGVETFCGLHPAIWWIGRMLRFERESAADEWVLRRTGAPHEYASCLATVADAALVDHPGRLLRGAGGLGVGAGLRRGDLLRRVERILGSVDRPPQRMPRMACATMATALVAGVIALRQLPVLVHVVDAPAPRETVARDVPLEAHLRTWPGMARVQIGGATGLASLPSSAPRGPERERTAPYPPRLAPSVRTLPTDTAILTATLQSLDTSMMPRSRRRAKSRARPERSRGELLLLRSSPLETAALAPKLSPATMVPLRGLDAANEQGERSDGRHWLRLPSLAKQTSSTATKTATSIAKATAESAVDVSGVVADFGRTRAVRSVGWFRRRLGL
ncbi:MAG: hypothetical protein GEV06_13085 [Luteitalea sp.]|nr:hypothetical protein [Luteitalea sp.]